MSACDACLQRSWLVAALAGHLERARRRAPEVLALPSEALIQALGGRHRDELRRQHRAFDAAAARAVVRQAKQSTRCRHGVAFPDRLLDLPDPPAALFTAGDHGVIDAVAGGVPSVAIVGSRRATAEGPAVARALGRELASAGVIVISGMALGIDSDAHAGSIAAQPSGGHPQAPTLAVLAGGADVVYPRTARGLYDAIIKRGCVISEFPPQTTPRKWMFPARNRVIAALSAMTVVVQAERRSGSLITAELAMDLGRPVGAVPGPVTSALADGTNALLHDGALVVRDAQDVLDAVVAGTSFAQRPSSAAPVIDEDLRPAWDAVSNGFATAGEVAVAAGIEVPQAMTALVRLELLGVIVRDPLGRYMRSAGARL